MRVEGHDTQEEFGRVPCPGGLQEIIAVSMNLILHSIGMNVAAINRIVSSADLNNWGLIFSYEKKLKARRLGQSAADDTIKNYLPSFLPFRSP